MIPPLTPGSLDDVKAALPPYAQGRFTTDADVLKNLVESRLREHDAILPTGTLAAQQSSQPAEEPIEDAAEPPPPAEETAPATEPVRSLRHDLLTIVVTGGVFTLTFLLTYYLATR